MTMLERIPSMADADLTTLGVNAMRLAQSGTPKQQKEASALLPVIEAELASRRNVKLAEKRALSDAARARRKAK